MKIKFEQKFHSVGQGLFYTSSLQLDSIFANIIFDCGSKDDRLINSKIDEYDKKYIDILIISHLHYDHVSGLEKLLQSKNVNIVVLPYLFPKERLLLKVINYNKPEWYKTFLTNPYSYLNKNKNVKKIIVINGDDDSNDYSVSFSDEFPPLNDKLIRENNIQINLEVSSKATRSQIEEDDGQIKFDDKRLLLMKDKGYISISQMYFSFFNYKINNNQKVINFEKQIKKLKINDTKSLLTKLQDPKKRELIKKSYEILRKDLNITSLATYQGFVLPFSNKKHSVYVYDINTSRDYFINNLFCSSCNCFIDAHFHGQFIEDYKCKFNFDCFCDCHKHCNCSKMVGTLLLGDIKLDYKTTKRKEMFTHFTKLLPSVKLVQLSHHGAKNGWNDDLINQIQRNSIYIAVHGTNNKYHHPHKNVLIKLAESNRKYISVTEKNEYHNRIEFSNYYSTDK